jgi:hypothetical protein
MNFEVCCDSCNFVIMTEEDMEQPEWEATFNLLTIRGGLIRCPQCNEIGISAYAGTRETNDWLRIEDNTDTDGCWIDEELQGFLRKRVSATDDDLRRMELDGYFRWLEKWCRENCYGPTASAVWYMAQEKGVDVGSHRWVGRKHLIPRGWTRHKEEDSWNSAIYLPPGRYEELKRRIEEWKEEMGVIEDEE